MRQTIVMITHDVDEAIYLSDRILVMSDGPNAHLAEAVSVDLPRPRDRAELLRSPRYHELRAHLLGFLTRGTREHQTSVVTTTVEPSALALDPALESGK
jgi:nitrate/nitrite transport system ATP-binding protein